MFDRSTLTIAMLASSLTPASLTACTSASVGLGHAVPTEQNQGDDKWVIEARAAAGGLVKIGVAARSKLGEVHDQLALAPELSLALEPGPVVIGARAGVHLLQWDRQYGEWTFGAGTTYLHPLLQLRIGDPVFIFVGGTIEYELNSNDGSGVWYLGAQLGVGIDL